MLRYAPIPPVGSTIVVDGMEGKHGAAALRLRHGEHVLIGDGAGVVAECAVCEASGSIVRAEVLKRTEHTPPRPAVVVVQALPKAERGELAVELATEAGADEIIPWQSARCVARWTGAKDKASKGHAKWVNAARAAAKQSRRPFEPAVGELHDTHALLGRVGQWIAADDVVIVLHEQATQPFGATMRAAVARDVARIVLIVGPEGGVATEEVAALQALGAHTALLGPEVLRTSTAAAVALAAIGVLTTRWGGPGEQPR